VPAGRVWVELKAPRDSAPDHFELAMIDAVYEDHAGVRALRRSPLTNDRGKVADVVCHEDPLLGGCGREHLLVI
jgi:hypothetical protein